MSQPILVIGYGNDLRSDDAVGQRVAQAIASWNLSMVRSFCVHQLPPKLATFLTSADLAIFIDACLIEPIWDLWRRAKIRNKRRTPAA